jgi:uncharacterized membrane protein
METFLVILVQWGHVLASIIWFGGTVFFEVVVMRALLARPGSEAAPLYELMGRYIAPLMTGSGMATLILGIIRGTLLGPIQSLDALFGTAYGLTWLVALILTIGLSVWGATWHSRRLGPIWEGDAIRPGARERIRMGSIVELAGFGLVLACMVLMASGY